MVIDFDAVRSLARWKAKYFEHAGIDEFGVDKIQTGVHTIRAGGLLIDIFAEINVGRPLVVILNGNTRRSQENKLPAFSGMKLISQKWGVSRISISDPSLYLAPDLSLAWYGGSA